MEKSEHICEIDPEPAIQAPGVESFIHEGIVPLHHHEAFAFEALHPVPILLTIDAIDS